MKFNAVQRTWRARCILLSLCNFSFRKKFPRAMVSRDTLRKIAATPNSITRISPGRKLNNKWHSLMNFIYLPPSLSLSPSTFTLSGWHGSIHSKERVTRSFSIFGEHIHRSPGRGRRQEDGAARGSQGSVRRQRGKREWEALQGTEHG